jgi:hypothetical protein
MYDNVKNVRGLIIWIDFIPMDSQEVKYRGSVLCPYNDNGEYDTQQIIKDFLEDFNKNGIVIENIDKTIFQDLTFKGNIVFYTVEGVDEKTGNFIGKQILFRL